MKTFKYTIITFALALILSPAFSHASTITEDTCAALPTTESKTTTRIDEFEAKRMASKDESAKELENAWKDEALARQQSRDAADAERKAQIEALLANAQTDAEKSAIADFSASIDLAITELRAKTDAAVATYEKAVRDIRTARIESADKLLANYKARVADEIAATKETCATPRLLKAATNKNLKAALDTLRTKFTKDYSADTATSAVKNLAKTRNATIAKAQTAFSQASKDAETLLRKAFAE